MKTQKTNISTNFILGTMEGNVTVELTAREFELLANAYQYWAEIIAPLRANSYSVHETTKLLREFFLKHRDMPF